jgi:hypothetical protein
MSGWPLPPWTLLAALSEADQLGVGLSVVSVTAL